jgi:hypothetical protein
VSLAEDGHVIQALAPDRADEPLYERVLPRAVRRRETLHAVPKWLPINPVAVAEETGRCGVVREGVDGLLRGPARGGVLGYVEVDDAPALVAAPPLPRVLGPALSPPNRRAPPLDAEIAALIRKMAAANPLWAPRASTESR